LRLDFEARRSVAQPHAGGDFVDVLAAGAARAHETLVEIRFADAQRLHPPLQLRVLGLPDAAVRHRAPL